MRVFILLLGAMATACGQTGSLYLPDEEIETPVEIRTSAPPPAPAPPPEDKDEEDEATKPPGR
jgi:predicted small lipoprotein YifL